MEEGTQAPRPAVGATEIREFIPSDCTLECTAPHISVRTYCHAPLKEPVEMPPMNEHLLAINLGPPMPVDGFFAGRWHHDVFDTGDYAFVPAHSGDREVWWWKGESRFLHIYLQPRLLNPGSNDVEVAPSFAVHDPLLAGIGPAIENALGQDELCIGSLEGLGRWITAHLGSRSESSAAGRLSAGRLRELDDYLHDHLERNISLSELAAVANLAPSHFSRTYKQATGESPFQRLKRYRMERAYDLLCQTVLPVQEVARRVGFEHQTHFARAFRRHYGASPSVVRQAAGTAKPIL